MTDRSDVSRPYFVPGTRSAEDEDQIRRQLKATLDMLITPVVEHATGPSVQPAVLEAYAFSQAFDFDPTLDPTKPAEEQHGEDELCEADILSTLAWSGVPAIHALIDSLFARMLRSASARVRSHELARARRSQPDAPTGPAIDPIVLAELASENARLRRELEIVKEQAAEKSALKERLVGQLQARIGALESGRE